MGTHLRGKVLLLLERAVFFSLAQCRNMATRFTGRGDYACCFALPAWVLFVVRRDMLEKRGKSWTPHRAGT